MIYEPHKLAMLFPPMSEEDYQKLKDSISTSGLLEPIALYENKVLDGVHRQKACSDLEVIPIYEEFKGSDPLNYVIAKNQARRHMTKEQLAILGVELLPLFEERAKQRMQTGGSLGGSNKGVDKSPHPSDRSIASRSTDEAGDALGVSGRHIRRAKNIKEKDPALFEEVKAGKKSLSAADKEIKDKAQPKAKKTTPTPPPPPPPASSSTTTNGHGRTVNWNGKTNPTRSREIKKTKNDSELWRAQQQISVLCDVLETIDLSKLDASDWSVYNTVDTVQDDLLNLSIWVERTLMAITAWVSDSEVREKIKKLRNTNGRTPEEQALFESAANRLEQKLERRLTSVTE